jgi:hypothetical protein
MAFQKMSSLRAADASVWTRPLRDGAKVGSASFGKMEI